MYMNLFSFDQLFTVGDGQEDLLNVFATDVAIDPVSAVDDTAEFTTVSSIKVCI